MRGSCLSAMWRATVSFSEATFSSLLTRFRSPENANPEALATDEIYPAVYNHKRTEAWFAGTVVFVIAAGRPHLRLYAHQDLDEIKRGSDFVAPQLINVPNHYISDLPNYPTAANHAEAGAVLKLRHSVDANGKTTGVQV